MGLEAGYAVAAANLQFDKQRRVSVTEVNDFMLNRAKKYPLCAFALLEMCMVTVAKLMRNVERKGDKGGAVKYFSVAIKLALPLFAVTHKSEYVYLCQELLKQYHCASPAQKIIYGHFVFLRKTSRGIGIFHDFLMELEVMDYRRSWQSL